MDTAYDHIAEETFGSDRAPTPTPPKANAPSTSTPVAKANLNTEIQETLHAFSNSPWGARLGGLWGNVLKQGEQYYEGARREVEDASEEARKGLSELKETVTKNNKLLSLDEDHKDESGPGESTDGSLPIDADHQGASTQSNKKRTESEVKRDNEGLVTRLRAGAAQRLKNIEKAEEAADEALLRFGANIRSFLREAVAIAPPSEGGDGNEKNGSVLFESKDSAGKRVIHTTRFDAQLHVIHSTSDSFTNDPVSAEWSDFKSRFRTDEKTEEISWDLEKYPDLRRAMEQVVPEKVEYSNFWCRYYFLRLVIETEEERRRELLKGASHQVADEEVTWDADSDSEPDDDQESPKKSEAPPSQPPSGSNKVTLLSNHHTSSTTTLTSQHQQPPPPPTVSITTPSGPETDSNNSSNPTDRHSHPDDSDASYDLVSGANSRTTGSPKEDGNGKEIGAAAGSTTSRVAEESDEEDWE